LKDNFKSLADHEANVRYLREDTIARYLEIPDVLGASPVIFQLVSYIGAFPFLQDAPAVLGLDQMVMVITIMTERYRRVLAKGSADRRKLLYKSLAVYDRKLSEMVAEERKQKAQENPAGSSSSSRSHAPGFVVDEAGEDEEDDSLDEEDDELVLAAFASLDYVDAFRHGNTTTIHGAMIPGDNFRKLIMLLLLIAPLDSQERLSQYSDRLIDSELDGLRSTADSILAAFLNVEKSPGIKFKQFDAVIPAALPFLFNGFNNLFEHFLFSKNVSFAQWRNSSELESKDHPAPVVRKSIDKSSSRPHSGSVPLSPVQPVQPLLQDTGSIMNLNLLSQLSFFIPGSSLFRRLRLLYSGENDGFSMGSFESKVFNWRAPTILLVRGTRIPPDEDREHRQTGNLPPRRFLPDNTTAASSSSKEQQNQDQSSLTFGLYVSQPWRITHRECFGAEDSLLFQLSPVHDVFRASSINKDWVSFSRVSSMAGTAGTTGGISVGCPPPEATSSTYRRSSVVSLGPVSLVLDSSFEVGCFTHDYTSSRGGGAFGNSKVRRFDFQERFEIDSLEVWGCGGDAEAKIQAERWAWEAREAEARRRINLGTGDIEADRALLEMAGLVGANRSGGSMA
jgi:hypothetical protein